MSWKAQNPAARTTWVTLMLFEQFTEGFSKAAAVKMNQLAFWKATQSESARRREAEALFIQMDNMFRDIRKAGFEHGMTRLQALEAMVAMLTSADQTVATLADVVDKHYRF